MTGAHAGGRKKDTVALIATAANARHLRSESGNSLDAATMDSAPIAQFYRDQAARLVRLAATSKFADVREQLTQIARQYEALARRSANRAALSAVTSRQAQS